MALDGQEEEDVVMRHRVSSKTDSADEDIDLHAVQVGCNLSSLQSCLKY